jgi:hypothetical protein
MGTSRRRTTPKSHKDALARKDADAWLAAERKELQLRNHKVHKTFEQLDRSSLQTDKRAADSFPYNGSTRRSATAPRKRAS